MGIFGSLLKLGMDVITTPIAIVKDVATLGGAITEEKSAIAEKLEQLGDDWEELRDEASQ